MSSSSLPTHLYWPTECASDGYDRRHGYEIDCVVSRSGGEESASDGVENEISRALRERC
jgi:hypothetical protein